MSISEISKFSLKRGGVLICRGFLISDIRYAEKNKISGGGGNLIFATWVIFM